MNSSESIVYSSFVSFDEKAAKCKLTASHSDVTAERLYSITPPRQKRNPPSPVNNYTSFKDCGVLLQVKNY